MNYITEGTITELTIEGKDCSFKLHGTEGYSVKYGNDMFNVLYSDAIKSISEANPILSYIIMQTKAFKCESVESNILAIAMTNGKKVKISIECEEDDLKDTSKQLKVTSITLLNN